MSAIPAIESYPMPAVGDLPTNTALWTVDPDRSVLLIHDMQRYFLRPLPESVRNSLVENTGHLRSQAVNHGVPIAYTKQPGGMSDQQRGLLKDFWGPGMSVQPTERDVIEPLSPGVDDWVLTKWRYSAFFRSDLLNRMQESGRDQLVVCGVYAHVGILMSLIDAFSNDIQPFLIADAVADFSETYHRNTLEYAATRCAVVTTAKETFA